MVYGYFFYPLFTLGMEHTCKVAEAALKIKCERMNASSKAKTFNSSIEYLSKMNILSDEQKNRWHILRQLRNHIAHPKDQVIYTPAMAIEFLSPLVREINDLFN